MKLVSYRTPSAFTGEPGREARLGIVEGEAVVATASLGHGVPGTMADLLRHKGSPTGQFLSGKRSIATPETVFCS